MGVHEGSQFVQAESATNLPSLRLYVLQDVKSSPAAIFMHGGSRWRGDKAQTEETSLLDSLLRQDSLVAVLYRLHGLAALSMFLGHIAPVCRTAVRTGHALGLPIVTC